jgi:hypothetical protein
MFVEQGYWPSTNLARTGTNQQRQRTESDRRYSHIPSLRKIGVEMSHRDALPVSLRESIPLSQVTVEAGPKRYRY